MFIKMTPIEKEYSGQYVTIYELQERTRKANNYSKRKEMEEEIKWIREDLLQPDDLTNLTVEQATLFGYKLEKH